MFIDFSIKDLIDILLVAYLLYQTYRLMKDSGSINIFIGILVFIGIWLIVSQVLEMKLLGSIFDKLVSVGVLALIILFQDDIRRFLVTLGSHKQLGRFFRFLTGNKQEKTEKADNMQIVHACFGSPARTFWKDLSYRLTSWPTGFSPAGISMSAYLRFM